MRSIVRPAGTPHTPESLLDRLRHKRHPVLLLSGMRDGSHARYSFLAVNPFLTFRSFGSRCEIRSAAGTQLQFGNPWAVLDCLLARYELLDEADLPFPLGGCFGYWGYDLKNFVEPKLPRRAVNDLELPDCQLGFYDSLLVFDHHLAQAWVVCTGLAADGSRDADRARRQLEWWQSLLEAGEPAGSPPLAVTGRALESTAPRKASGIRSSLCRTDFVRRVEQAQALIRAGDIYQVNLSHRLAVPYPASGWELFRDLSAVSPAPFSAFLDGGDFQIVSSSPECFLRLSGSQVRTRPIKGTRPRSYDPTRDAQLSYELQTSAKEMAELVMITDLLRNDLGKVCEFGSVQVPELVRLERYAHVQHLVSTVEGRLRPDLSHLDALTAAFPGGSITGAPKFRAMQIIDDLEPVSRGPYTGALGYLGFNRESQLSIAIRIAICRNRTAYFHAGAGIVADSVPEAEYEETLAKAGGFLAALQRRKFGPASERGLPVGEGAMYRPAPLRP